MIEILKSIIIEGQELLTELRPTERVFEFEPVARYVFVGVRQAGKSYLMYLRALQLLKQGHALSEILMVNFDDERLLGFKASDFDLLLQAYSALFPHKPILFLDEIQNIDGWEHFARRLANRGYLAYLTGSNAKMLSRDIATVLGARYIEQHVFTYSFREFLASKGVYTNANKEYGQKKGEIDLLLNTYFIWGGFPELDHYVNKRKWLNELYEKIILGDIIQRNGIRNEQALRLTVRRLAECVKTPVSFNRLANLLKTAGLSTTATSVSEYIGNCKDACFIFELENYASKFAERASLKKYYFCDNGLLNIFLTNSETSLIENLCAIILYRNEITGHGDTGDLYYYNKECELDFFIPSVRKGIQVAYSISNPLTRERELNGLLEFHRKYGLNEAEIVTYSESDTIEQDGLCIKVVPLAEWLLQHDAPYSEDKLKQMRSEKIRRQGGSDR